MCNCFAHLSYYCLYCYNYESHARLKLYDIAFLVAMLDDEEYSRISDIAARMNVSSKYAGEYRRSLIAQGIIGSRGYGKVAFDLPMFREYLQTQTGNS